MSEAKYDPKDIASAHEKQSRAARGQGGVKFTPVEQEILDNHVNLPPQRDDGV